MLRPSTRVGASETRLRRAFGCAASCSTTGKKMKALFLTALACLGLITTGLARVGETEKEIEARYGKPGKDMGMRGNVHQIGYMSGGFMILVDFVNGVSQREGFANPDSTPLTNDAIDEILRMNTPEGLTWEPGRSPGEDKAWQRSDGKVIALCPSPRLFLFFQDVNYKPPK